MGFFFKTPYQKLDFYKYLTNNPENSYSNGGKSQNNSYFWRPISNLKLKMKKLLLIFSMLLAYLGSNAQGVWTSQSTGFSATSSGVTNIAVVNANVVWVSALDAGGAARQDYSRTTDGGAHWVTGTIPAPANWIYAMIAATDSSNAWAAFYNNAAPKGLGQVYHTTDGGANWTQQAAGLIFSTTGSFVDVIHFWDNLNGVVVGDPVNGEYEIYTTIDGGTNWVPVPPASIPNPDAAGEVAFTTHISVAGNSIWFDTNHGRVFSSSDRGYHWNVSTTNLILPAVNPSIDLCFYNSLSGIARYYDDVAIYSDVVQTSDGGLTWSSTFSPDGFFGFDVKAVPGTDSMLVSTGQSSNSGFTGSSYSLNGGHSWTNIDAGVRHFALGIADSLTMWSGSFTTSPTQNGIFKFTSSIPVACSDPGVSPGTATANDTAICGGDTVVFTSTGILSPSNGAQSGLSWVISSANISHSTNPKLETSYMKSLLVTFPAPATDSRLFINNGSLIDGLNYPYGIYYWTPVVFGNATALSSPVQHLEDLTLDGNCTFVGTSIAVHVLNPNDPSCGVGVSEIKANQLSVHTFIKDRNTIDVLINSAAYGKVSIQITDLAGRLVKNQNSYVSNGSNHELINIEDLASGTYILKTEVNGNRASNKVVKY